MRLEQMIKDFKIRRIHYRRIDLLKFVDLLLEDRNALRKPKKAKKKQSRTISEVQEKE